MVAIAMTLRRCMHLLEAMLLLCISGCNGNVVKQAEAHGLVGCGMMAGGSGNGVACRHLHTCYALA